MSVSLCEVGIHLAEECFCNLFAFLPPHAIPLQGGMLSDALPGLIMPESHLVGILGGLLGQVHQLDSEASLEER